MLAILVPWGPYYPQSPISFLLEVFHNILKAFVFLKMAESNVQKPLDESNEISADDLMGMTLHVDLHL